MIQLIHSEGWSHFIQALLHTLWTSSLLAGALYAGLKRVICPRIRYSMCLLAMVASLVSGVIAWAMLSSSSTLPQGKMAGDPMAVTAAASGPEAAPSFRESKITPSSASSATREWVGWLGVPWMIGMCAMLIRSASMVMRAEGIRRKATSLNQPAILQQLKEVQARLNIRKRVRMAVTDQLASPAVMGFFTVTLLFPASLLTALSPAQLELILLHELAHVRRGDYLVNILQMLVESVLFFNPSVWWISRQARLEREASCDAIAAQNDFDKTAYAQALAVIAENRLSAGGLAAMTAVPDGRMSTLRDRVQRLLTPHYHPEVRPTWKAWTGAILAGFMLIFLSAMGTRWTVLAAERLLTASERIEKIQSVTRAFAADGYPSKDSPKARVAISILDPEGKPASNPHGKFMILNSGITTFMDANADANGIVAANLPPGMFYFAAWSSEYPPQEIGPIQTTDTNTLKDLRLTLRKGFNTKVVVRDQNTGQPLANSIIKTFIKFPEKSGSYSSLTPAEWKTDQAGQTVLSNISQIPLRLAVHHTGYELNHVTFTPNEGDDVFTLQAAPALPFQAEVANSGGKAIPGAKVHVIYPSLGPPSDFPKESITSLQNPIAVTDQNGRFEITQFPRNEKFILVIDSPGQAYEIVEDVMAGQKSRVIRLRPEKVVEGAVRLPPGVELQPKSMHVNGNVNVGSYNAYYQLPVKFEPSSWTNSDGSIQPLALFRFTNRFEGKWTLSVSDQIFSQDMLARHEPLELLAKAERLEISEKPKKREVVFKFKHSSSAAPSGIVTVMIRENILSAPERTLLQLTNGESRVLVPTGSSVSFRPSETIGFWFPPVDDLKIEDERGPKIIVIPAIAAGAIYATARHEGDGLASQMGFTVIEEEKSPLLKTIPSAYFEASHYSLEGAKGIVSGPLPLYGKYRVIMSLGNNFVQSDPIYLTEAEPDRRVELSLKAGVGLQGRIVDAFGNVIPGAEATLQRELPKITSILQTKFSDAAGNFSFDGLNTQMPVYRVEATAPGFISTNARVDLSAQPLKITMSQGFHLAGHVLDVHTSKPLAGMAISVFRVGGGYFSSKYLRTDSEGAFEYTTLPPGKYRLQFLNEPPLNEQYDAGDTTITLMHYSRKSEN